ncbi:MAG TPA: hypothetical protein VG412_03510 [Acidimicrobiales bacterium]|nr:hypothetical protein [Acidimicrobiales bacterium]
MAWFGKHNERERINERKRYHERERPLAAASSRLIADAEAFLSGDYADHLFRKFDMVPGWARLNAFAHGDLEKLRRARRSPVVRPPAMTADPAAEEWVIAHRILADELLELVDGDAELLGHVQESVLVPLEFVLMHEDDLTAFDLVQFTRAALRSSIS